MPSGRWIALPRSPRGSTRRSSVLWSRRKGDMGQTLCLISSVCHPPIPSSSAYTAISTAADCQTTRAPQLGPLPMNWLQVEATPIRLPLGLSGNHFYQDSTCSIGQSWSNALDKIFHKPDLLSWALQCGVQSVLPFCLSAWLSHSGQPPPLAAPENKQPSLSFQGGVLTLRCLCCSCHLLSLFFCCRSPMARPPVMAGVLPTGSWCREAFFWSNINIWPLSQEWKY